MRKPLKREHDGANRGQCNSGEDGAKGGQSNSEENGAKRRQSNSGEEDKILNVATTQKDETYAPVKQSCGPNRPTSLRMGGRIAGFADEEENEEMIGFVVTRDGSRCQFQGRIQSVAAGERLATRVENGCLFKESLDWAAGERFATRDETRCLFKEYVNCARGEDPPELIPLSQSNNGNHPRIEVSDPTKTFKRARGGIAPPTVESAKRLTAPTSPPKPNAAVKPPAPPARTAECCSTGEEDSLEEFRAATNCEAQRLINGEFARKVVQMDALLKHEMFRKLVHADESARKEEALDDDDDVTESGPATKRRRVVGKAEEPEKIEGCCAVPQKCFCGKTRIYAGNIHIDELVDIVRPRLVEMHRHAKLIRTWITLGTPRIEDGNNFGVSVQEAVLMEASCMEQLASKRLEAINVFYMSRVNHVQRTIDHPTVADARRALREVDHMMFNTLQSAVIDMRDKYAGMLDMLKKNVDKMNRPRIDNTASMY